MHRLLPRTMASGCGQTPRGRGRAMHGFHTSGGSSLGGFWALWRCEQRGILRDWLQLLHRGGVIAKFYPATNDTVFSGVVKGVVGSQGAPGFASRHTRTRACTRWRAGSRLDGRRHHYAIFGKTRICYASARPMSCTRQRRRQPICAWQWAHGGRQQLYRLVHRHGGRYNDRGADSLDRHQRHIDMRQTGTGAVDSLRRTLPTSLVYHRASLRMTLTRPARLRTQRSTTANLQRHDRLRAYGRGKHLHCRAVARR